MGWHFLLQGIFLDHGWNPCLLHWQTDSLPLNHRGSHYTQTLNVLFLWDLLPINLNKYAANFPAQPNPGAGRNCKGVAPTILTTKLQHFCRVLWPGMWLCVKDKLYQTGWRQTCKRRQKRLPWLRIANTFVDTKHIVQCVEVIDDQPQFISRLSGSTVKSLSRVRLFATPWTVAYQAPPSVGFSRQEWWSGLPFPSPGDLPNPGIEPGSPALQADALPSEPPGKL